MSTSQPVNRKQRKAVEAINRKQVAKAAAVAKAVAQSDPYTKLQNELMALARQLDEMREPINTNFREITNAFQLSDGHLFVHRRILNDIAKNEVVKKDEDIDYAWYLLQWQSWCSFISFFRWVQFQKNNAPQLQEEEDDFVFGETAGGPAIITP